MNTEELIAENERLKKEISDLNTQVKAAETKIRRAKDISPIERPTLRRVMQLAADACLTVTRVRGGWQLRIGGWARRFKRLKQIWELLITDDWILSELFPPAPPGAQRRILPKPILRRNPCIAPSYGASDRTLVPNTE